MGPHFLRLITVLAGRGEGRFKDGVRFVVVVVVVVDVDVFIVHFSRQCCWKQLGKLGLSVAKKQHSKVRFLVAEQGVMKEIYKKVILEQKLRQFLRC